MFLESGLITRTKPAILLVPAPVTISVITHTTLFVPPMENPPPSLYRSDVAYR